MKRWELFVGLAVCAVVATGCGKEAAAPDPTWAAVPAKCQEAMKSYPGFNNKTAVTRVEGDCERFEFRPVAGPQEWQQFREEVYVVNPGQGFPTPPITDTERVAKEPPDQEPIAELLEYGDWRDPLPGDLDSHGQPIKGVQTIGKRYLPLYRWGCQAPSDPKVTLRCKLKLTISTRVEQSKELSSELGISLGVGDTSNGIGGIEGKLEKADKQVLSTWIEAEYPATVTHDIDRTGEDHKWFITELRDYQAHLVRDVYLCKKYGTSGAGYVRFQLYCQLLGLQYQRIEAVEFYNIITASLTGLKERIQDQFPGLVITPEAQQLLHELEQVSNDVEPINPPMPKGISCETNVDCQTERAGVEVTASTMSKFGLSVSIGGGQEETFSLTGTGGLSVTAESTISAQQVHSLEFGVGGPANRLIALSYRRSDLHTGKAVGSYYRN